MYVLLNQDQTINYVGDHPIDSELYSEGLQCIELPNQTVAELVGDAPLETLQWDIEQKAIVINPVFEVGSEPWRRQQASRRIQQVYPLFKQLNLLRSGDKAAIKRMVVFIDKCRKWSNDIAINPTIIDRIQP